MAKKQSVQSINRAEAAPYYVLLYYMYEDLERRSQKLKCSDRQTGVLWYLQQSFFDFVYFNKAKMLTK